MGRPRLDRPNYRLRKNRAGFWEIHWTEDGRTRRFSVRTSDPVEARKRADQFVAQRDLIRIDEPTVSAICNAYLETRKPHLARPENLEFSLARIKDGLGNIHPSMISQTTVNEYARKRKRANATVVRELKCLRAALAWARDNLGTPAPRFRMPVPDSQPRNRWLTKDEARKLIAACTAHHIELFVRLALATGARSNAILELTWDRVDLDKGRINLGESVGKKRRAIVPVNDQLKAALHDAANIRATDHVIEYHGKPVGSIKKSLARAGETAGVGRIGSHVLRHTAATWMVQDGIPYEQIARYLGATVAMVENTYGHHSPDYLARASKALEF